MSATGEELGAIWQTLLVVHGAVDHAVAEEDGSRVLINAALGTLSRAIVALEDLRTDVDAEDEAARAIRLLGGTRRDAA